MKIKSNIILVLLFAITFSSISQNDTSNTNEDYLIAISSLISDDPTVDSLYFYRSCAYFMISDKSSALLDVNKAISLNNNNKQYYEFKADIFFSMEEFDSASHYYNKVISFDSSRLYLHGKLINSYISNEDYLSALKTIDRAEKSIPIIISDEHFTMRIKNIYRPLDSIYYISKRIYEIDTTDMNALFYYGFSACLSYKNKEAYDLLIKYRNGSSINKYNSLASLILGALCFERQEYKKACAFISEAYLLGEKIPKEQMDNLMHNINKHWGYLIPE
ncbi:MAG: hypothetical protein K8R63_13890 [Bacteroidales bacterium]|nr:hypothetical protein [Bacteroidales bacterium]